MLELKEESSATISMDYMTELEKMHSVGEE